jgi:hypothetical protein
VVDDLGPVDPAGPLPDSTRGSITPALHRYSGAKDQGPTSNPGGPNLASAVDRPKVGNARRSHASTPVRDDRRRHNAPTPTRAGSRPLRPHLNPPASPKIYLGGHAVRRSAQGQPCHSRCPCGRSSPSDVVRTVPSPGFVVAAAVAPSSVVRIIEGLWSACQRGDTWLHSFRSSESFAAGVILLGWSARLSGVDRLQEAVPVDAGDPVHLDRTIGTRHGCLSGYLCRVATRGRPRSVGRRRRWPCASSSPSSSAPSRCGCRQEPAGVRGCCWVLLYAVEMLSESQRSYVRARADCEEGVGGRLS